MKSITIEKFAKKYVERNKDENLKDVKIRLKEALKRKNSGIRWSSIICNKNG